MSIGGIHLAVVEVAKQRLRTRPGELEYLDIGAGRGELIGLMQSEFSVNARGCDYHIELFGRKDVPIDKIDLDREYLPYANDSFDIITCSEVVEHLENYRRLFREIHRVLKPGGLLIVTTPNVLNMKSRLRYLGSGFYNLFGPLPVKNEKKYSLGAHITPIPFFYLAHALHDSDFTDIRLDIDRRQRSSTLWVTVLSPILLVSWLLFLRREYVKLKKITDANKKYVYKHADPKVLTGRTLIVSALK
jgi:SAM-dependent methyltransferase